MREIKEIRDFHRILNYQNLNYYEITLSFLQGLCSKFLEAFHLHQSSTNPKMVVPELDW